MYSSTSASLWIGLSSSTNSSPLIRDSMSDSRRSSPSRLAISDQQRVADRVSVIVVDVLEIVDVEKRQRETALSVVVLQETVDAMLDHAPRRQAGQLVVIGGTEQVILERLLFGDVGRARDQQIAPGDRTGRCEVRNTCLAEPPATASSSTAGRPVRSNSRQVSRRSPSCGADGAAAAASSRAAAASFISTNSPCSS